MVIKGVHEVCESAREGGFTGGRPVCMLACVRYMRESEVTEMSVRVRGEVATRMSTQGKSVRTRLGERMCVCVCVHRASAAVRAGSSFTLGCMKATSCPPAPLRIPPAKRTPSDCR